MKRNAAIFKVETKDVPELVARFNLSGASTVVFFYDNSVLDRLPGDKIKKNMDERKSFLDVVREICQTKQISLRATRRG